MAVQWPLALQQLLNEEGFTQTFGETRLRSEMDIGPAKIRRRFTRGIDTFSTTIDIKFEEYAAFENFVKVTTNGATDPFEFLHPISKVNTLFRFIDMPSITPLGGRVFRVNMSWESLGDA